MSGPTYLVTGVGGPAGRAVAGELFARGRHVVGVDAREVGWAPYPTRVVPPASSSRFVPTVFELCRAYAVRVVVPTVTEELPVLAAVKQTAQRGGITIAVGDPLSVNVASDKWLTFQCLQLMSVAVPETVLAGEMVTATEVQRRLGLPVLRKPRSGRGARGVTVHRDPRTILDGITEDRFVLQEFLPGAEYAVNLYLSADGGVAGGVLRKDALTGGEVGNGVAVSRVDDLDVGALAVAAVRAIGLFGPSDVDIRRRADGMPAVLEINARYGAHCAAAPEVIDALMQEHEVPAVAA
ncbi:ATP-grasp domain-containing protein [Allorhizocola rhizosphaerae]|uniref:ATP-grasp domain-containing protein n=1 Tax=Allorhizocola rhizosphaerae TaxID=1872709 RepID=UPI000E3B7A19|nr:ATP-grasp domain-containing protein [Allorhizocola rhizosphaerae]